MTREIFDFEAWRQILVGSAQELTATLVNFVPSLIATLALLALGWVVSKLAGLAAHRGLARLGLDRAADRVGLNRILERAGVRRSCANLFGYLLFWVVMLTFVLSAVETLGLTAVTHTIDRLIAFLPDVLAAGLILILGLLLARFVRNLVSSASVAAGLPEAQRIGAVSGVATSFVVVVVALEQLGVETSLLIAGVSALLLTFGLTVGLAFALGARPIVTHILAGHFLRKTLIVGSSVEVRGERGVVDSVGATETCFRGSKGSWSVPNALLLEEVVRR